MDKFGFLFAGQGSQYVGMGKDLYDSFEESKAVFDKADEVLKSSISRLCFEGPKEELTRTKNCQPAILTMSIAAFEAAKAKGISLDKAGYMAGLSLGEYSALVAAEAMSFKDAVYLVSRRGQFMEEEAANKPGKMLSVIGMDLDAVKQLCKDTSTEIANINCPGQVVISGAPAQIEQAKALAEERKARLALLLDVSGAFHSSFMQGASSKLAGELEKINIQKPRIPVISNVTAKPFVSAQEIKDNLIRQVSASVLWEDSMRFIIANNINKFFEFGPGKVLKGLMRRIDANIEVKNVEKKEDIVSL